MNRTFAAAAAIACLSASGAPAAAQVPPVGPAVEADDGRIRTRTIAVQGRAVSVEVQAGAHEAIRKIHEERRRYYAESGRSHPDPENLLYRLDARMWASDRRSSLLLRLTGDGHLVGLLRFTEDPYQPIVIMMAPNEDRRLARLEFLGAGDADGGLVIRSYDENGTMFRLRLVTAFNFETIDL